MTRSTDPSPLLIARRIEQARIRKEHNTRRVFVRQIRNDLDNQMLPWVRPPQQRSIQ